MPTRALRPRIPAVRRAPGLRRAASLALIALGAGAVQALPAAASSGAPEGPEYSLSIVEGESTQPEYQIVHTSAHVHPHASLAVSIVRGGIVIARDPGTENVWLSQIPQVGDVVSLESPIGTVVGSVVYDGLPSIDPSVCAGSTNFSGQRSGGQSVTGGYYSLVLHTDPYGHSSLHETSSGQAQVTVLAGATYGGGFLTPLALGQTVWATESLQTPLAGGATFAYSSENDRPVIACPVPPAPPVPPPPPALLGSVVKFVHTTIHRLLVSGWVDHVTINQPGTVTQGLYQAGGSLPAFASAAKHARHKRRKPPALLLAHGSATASAAGTVTVTIRVTAKGRRVLKRSARVKAILVTTLSSNSGAKLTVERRSVTLHR